MTQLRPTADLKPPRTVLFLCTGNSARSIIAEALLEQLGAGRFRSLSAGSRPNGAVNPHALDLLRKKGLVTEGLRSKSWSEFEGLRAPNFDIVVTLCDSAAREACPVWPGAPVRCHWGIPDPVAATGSEKDILAAFEKTYARLERRIKALLDLPLDELEPASLTARLNDIGLSADGNEKR
jgi:arsenate reductase (thioredoxin)